MGHRGALNFSSTDWGIECYGESVEELREQIVESLNESPLQASTLLNHDDLRVRLATLECTEYFCTKNEPLTTFRPHVFVEIAMKVAQPDPFEAGFSLGLLQKADCWILEALRSGMNHPSAYVRIDAAEYFRRLINKLHQDELLDAMEILVQHLVDPNLVASAVCHGALRDATKKLDSELPTHLPGDSEKEVITPIRVQYLAGVEGCAAAWQRRLKAFREQQDLFISGAKNNSRDGQSP